MVDTQQRTRLSGRTGWLRVLASAAFMIMLPVAQTFADNGAEIHTDSLQIQVESETLARRGEGVVTQAAFDAFLSRMPEHHRPLFLSDSERIAQALDKLMMPRQLLHEARESGFADNPELQAKLFQSAVVLIAEEYLDYLWQEERLDDYSQQARELFITRPELVRPPVEVDFVHVLVQSAGQRGELDAMRRVLSIYEKLGEDEALTLAQLAKEYSEDPLVDENSGHYEKIDINSLEEEVAAYLRYLEPGQISEPFRSSQGWHIVQLNRRARPEVDSFEQVKERALKVAERDHREQVRGRHIASLFEPPLELPPGAIEKLVERHEATEEDLDKLMEGIKRHSGQTQ